jgi:ferredoxin
LARETGLQEFWYISMTGANRARTVANPLLVLNSTLPVQGLFYPDSACELWLKTWIPMAEDDPRHLKSALDSVPEVDPARCTGCGRCIAACSPKLFSFEQRGWRKVSVLSDPEGCTRCGKCVVECPVGAISVDSGLAFKAGL